MNDKLILDIILAIGGILALIGLGGAVSLSRGGKRHEVQITVKQDYGAAQVVTVPEDSVVVTELNKLAGVHISSDGNMSEANSSASSDLKKNRRLEIGGLVGGVAASLAAVLPFVAASEIIIAVASAVGALFVTSVGVVLGRLKSQFTGEEWRASTPKKQAKAIRDAALLREIPPL